MKHYYIIKKGWQLLGEWVLGRTAEQAIQMYCKSNGLVGRENEYQAIEF